MYVHLYCLAVKPGFYSGLVERSFFTQDTLIQIREGVTAVSKSLLHMALNVNDIQKSPLVSFQVIFITPENLRLNTVWKRGGEFEIIRPCDVLTMFSESEIYLQHDAFPVNTDTSPCNRNTTSTDGEGL